MSVPFDETDLPPAYDDLDDSKEVLQPVILVLAGQSIHAESADSEPLYQLSRAVANLGKATEEVEFRRVEKVVKNNSNGEPTVRIRPHQVYRLRHVRSPLGKLDALPSYVPQYMIHAVSRRALGHIGLKKHRLRSHVTALGIDVSGKRNDRGVPQFRNGTKPVFEVRSKKDRYEWTDGQGNPLAVEDEGEGQHRLVVTASLHRETMDALVALWCCRIWKYSVDHEEHISEGWEGVARKLRLSSTI